MQETSDCLRTNHASAKFNTGRWTTEEHDKFLHALQLYGIEWKKVQEYVGTRTSTQARSHAQKFFYKLDKNTDVIPSVKGELTKSPKKKPKVSLSEHPTPVVERTSSEVFKVLNDPMKKMSDSSVKVVLNISQFNLPHSTRRLTFGGEDLENVYMDGFTLSTRVSNEEPMIEECPRFMSEDLMTDMYSYSMKEKWG